LSREAAEKEDSVHNRCQERQAECIKRLKGLGDYTDQDFQYCRSFFRTEWNDMTFQSRPLSDAVWERIKPKLIALLDVARKELQ